ncbi:hypothetical protein AQUCO_00100733v1 [Aquilegia coerulea]|uniref:Uncharacterized protein n=1 Tax=Aquilegia coerulea TaxID=218851 RepID=A0A2G5FBY0_AQUCA|nr:hypothetical protein AQUCO_00100733v1 [Aquilegia coerulea]
MYVLLDASFLRYWFNSIVLNKLQYVWVFSLSELLSMFWYVSCIFPRLFAQCTACLHDGSFWKPLTYSLSS